MLDPEYRKTSNNTQLPIQRDKAQRELLSVSLKLLKFNFQLRLHTREHETVIFQTFKILLKLIHALSALVGTIHILFTDSRALNGSSNQCRFNPH